MRLFYLHRNENHVPDVQNHRVFSLNMQICAFLRGVAVDIAQAPYIQLKLACWERRNVDA